MKKFFAILLVLVIMMVTLVSCGNNADSQTMEDSHESEEVVVYDFSNYTYNYGRYYMFKGNNYDIYLAFLDTMSDDIEIIDISISESRYAEHYIVTYKQ